MPYYSQGWMWRAGQEEVAEVVVRCARIKGFGSPTIRFQPAREACVPDWELHQCVSVLFVVLFSDSLVGWF